MIKTPLRLLAFLLLFFTGLGLVNALYAQSPSDRFVYSYPYEEGELEESLGKTPVVLELFSSQACMFCPMADHFFKDLERKTDLIIMACHVDYFDVQNGAISTAECSGQQRAYQRKIKGATLYTPQVIVNGRDDYIGYDFERYMERVIEQSKASTIQPLNVNEVTESVISGKRYEIDLVPFANEEGNDAKDLDIWMYLIEPDHNIVVSEGANEGKELPYVNIVRKSQKIGRWDGTAQRLGFTVDSLEGYKGVIVALRDHKDRISAVKQINF